MEICAAALPFLILAAALGPPAQASLRFRSAAPELGMKTRLTNPPYTLQPGKHTRDGCCLYYKIEITQCELMTDYFPRTSGCLMPAIVFTTREGIGICAFPGSETVKQCMKDLDSVRKPGKGSVEEKLQ